MPTTAITPSNPPRLCVAMMALNNTIVATSPKNRNLRLNPEVNNSEMAKEKGKSNTKERSLGSPNTDCIFLPMVTRVPSTKPIPFILLNSAIKPTINPAQGIIIKVNLKCLTSVSSQASTGTIIAILI